MDDFQALQQQDDLEKQEELVMALDRLYLNSTHNESHEDVALLASAIGVSWGPLRLRRKTGGS